MRLALGAAAGESADSDLDRGDGTRLISLPLLALRKGEGERPTMGGVAVRDTGGVGFLMAGLSQDEKKSSSTSAEGVVDPSASAATSVMTTESGYLHP